MKYSLKKSFLDAYYMVKPLIPREIQLYVRRKIMERTRSRNQDVWPINELAGNPPLNWRGWPNGKRFALVLTHDVETKNGYNKCRTLLKLEKSLGFLSSYNFVARKYTVSMETIKYVQSNNFEIGVHGLYHDGKYFKSREEFERRANHRDLTWRYYRWVTEYGTYSTGACDAFREFWFFGALLFFVIGRGFRFLWDHAYHGESTPAMLAYVSVCVIAMRSVVNNIGGIPVQLVIILALLTPVFCLSCTGPRRNEPEEDPSPFAEEKPPMLTAVEC